MLKALLTGILLGIAATAGGLYALPLVDQHREASILSVATNGGTTEQFHVNIPMDRIMIGAPQSDLPEGIDWPDDEALAGVSSELFKLRNARDSVIGVAARTVVENAGSAAIEWAIHMPARGSLFYNMNIEAVADGNARDGVLRAGTREFESFSGSLRESWVALSADSVSTETADELMEGAAAPTGRLVLEARYIGQLEPVE